MRVDQKASPCRRIRSQRSHRTRAYGGKKRGGVPLHGGLHGGFQRAGEPSLELRPARRHRIQFHRNEPQGAVSLRADTRLQRRIREKDEIKKLAEIDKVVKPDFIKTSTGFGTGGALVEDVKLMKEVVGDEVQVKAAGGIRDWATCKKMIEAGATRIGTSSSFAILKGFDDEHVSV